MPNASAFPLVVAIDDSAAGRAVVAAALAFPWPEPTLVRGIVATRTRAAAGRPEYVRAAFARGFEQAAARARRVLTRRWRNATVALVDEHPVDAIVAEAQRHHARAIAMGWRGHGLVQRLFVGGSVCRGVIRRARCAVLVVKGHSHRARHLVIGLDGSRNAERAATFVAGLERPRGARVTLVRVVEPLRVPSLALMPSHVRETIGQQIAAENAAAIEHARHDVERVKKALADAGWQATGVVRSGVPLAELLSVVKAVRADVVVVGARGAGGLRTLLLGSVSQGTLERADTDVLIVR
jgi:nucleotide-binding universal stress UspA family protein